MTERLSDSGRDASKAMGANVINIHHSQRRQADDQLSVLRPLDAVLEAGASQAAHAHGVKVKSITPPARSRITCRNFSRSAALTARSSASPGRDGIRPIRSPTQGPHPWLVEHLGESGFIPAWRDVLGGRYNGMLDLAVITTPDSRLDNFYLEGPGLHLARDGFRRHCTSTTRRWAQGVPARPPHLRGGRQAAAGGHALLEPSKPDRRQHALGLCLHAEFSLLSSHLARRGLQLQRAAGRLLVETIRHPLWPDERNARRRRIRGTAWSLARPRGWAGAATRARCGSSGTSSAWPARK